MIHSFLEALTDEELIALAEDAALLDIEILAAAALAELNRRGAVQQLIERCST